MSRCVSGKRMYVTREIAETVLLEAWARYEFAPSSGPIAVYLCEDCSQYHLTSKGPMNEALAEALRAGKIGRQKEANKWMDYFKRK